MFGVIADGDRLVDKQNRDAVLDAIRTPQPWVVKAFVVDQ